LLFRWRFRLIKAKVSCDKKEAGIKMAKAKKTKRFRSDVQKNLFRVPISVTKEMETWLQGLSNEMKASGGYKLPKSYVVRSILNAVMKLDLDVSNVKTESELIKRFLKAIKECKKCK